MTSPDPKLTGAGQAAAFDSYACRYLEEHVTNFIYEHTDYRGNPPPEKTTWWKGGEFLELMFPAEGWRLEDGRILLFNGRSHPIWLRLPSRVIRRPPKTILEQVPAAKHEFHEPEMTEAKKLRVSSDILKKWELPLPALRDFIAVMRPILQKQCARIMEENKREEAKWERGRAAWLRSEQRKERNAARLSRSPEAIASQTPEDNARTKRLDTKILAHFAESEARERVEREEVERTGNKKPVGWDPAYGRWEEWLRHQTITPTEEDVERARIWLSRIDMDSWRGLMERDEKS